MAATNVLGDQPNNDFPVLPITVMGGYQRKTDSTKMPYNTFTYPSQNCIIPNSDKIVPRGDSLRQGQEYTGNFPIVGHAKKFRNLAGDEMEVRMWKSGGAKGDVVEVLYTNPLTNETKYWQITENVNTLTLGVNDRYYTAEWQDTNLGGISLNLKRLIWVDGTNTVKSWTGGIAPIVSITSTSITIPTGTTWIGNGFVDPADGGTGVIIVNGVAYTGLSGWNTNTLNVASTTGISANDVAFAKVEQDTTTVALDNVNATVKNYAIYGNEDKGNFFMSNAFNRISTQMTTRVQAVQNDLVIPSTANFTGTGSHVYRITIDSVNPQINEQSFLPGGSGTLNDAVYNTASYSGTSGVTNTYNIVVLGDFTIIVDGLLAGAMVGQTVSGATSNAEGVIVAVSTFAGNNVLGIRLLTPNGFVNGETITSTMGNTALIQSSPSNGTRFQNWIQYLKNGNVINLSAGSLTPSTAPVVYLTSNTPITLSDGLTIVFENNFGHAIGDSFTLKINRGTYDTFAWQVDGGTAVTGVPITGGTQSLSDGVEISFTNKTGHTLGDFWDITADQQVTRAWANFYYGLPRKPGEGYVGNLPSNFWAICAQEGVTYINCSHGEWQYIETELSADLLTETVNIVPLKQSSSNKMLYPYMVTNSDNDIIFLNERRAVCSIGRKELIELPQISNISDLVKLDLLEMDFLLGSMEYWDAKLWINAPRSGKMMVYDNAPETKYWQFPQFIPENGILSVVGDQLISHSSIRNVTNEIMLPYRGDGDNSSSFTTRVRSAFNAYDDRWNLKAYTATFIEGRMAGLSHFYYDVVTSNENNINTQSHIVVPKFSRTTNRASIGSAELGAHPLGSDIPEDTPIFREIFLCDPTRFYYAALDLSCAGLGQDWEIYSLGINAFDPDLNNQLLVSNQNVI